MDAKTAEKVGQLARSMKDLHLAATIDEAYERAKEIILGTPTKNKQKIGDVLNEFDKIKQNIEHDEQLHDTEKKDTAVILEEMKKQKKSLEQAKDIVEAAEHSHHE